MESDAEDLDNIFEEYENTDNAERADDTENAETPNETGVKVPVPKRVPKHPRLKFNPERLCGERGIPVLVDHFKNVKFKGAGHEKEDLDKLLSKLEHWTHRLFPSMKFEDCLHHIEKLGKKRPVQTCLRKMRLNMPILSKDFVEDEEDNVLRNDDQEPVEMEMDAFDRLLGESQDVTNSDVRTTENILDSNLFDSSPVQSSYGPGQVLGTAQTSNLSDEQRERIERNKMLAIERRKARLAAAQNNSCQFQSLTSKAFPSKSASNQQDIFSASTSRNEENISITADDSVTEFSNNSGTLTDNFSVLSNQNTDGLGLDDLVDLVDEEEPVSNKCNQDNAIENKNTKDVSDGNHQNTDSLGLNDLIDMVDEEESETVSDAASGKLSSVCIDLVDDEDSFSSKNNKESKSNMEFDKGNLNKNTKDDVSDVKNQTTENLGLNDFVEMVEEEESEIVSDVIASEKLKCAYIDKVNKSNSEADFQKSQPNVDASISEITDIEMSALDDKVSKAENGDNLAIDSLLDLVDEDSVDN